MLGFGKSSVGSQTEFCNPSFKFFPGNEHVYNASMLSDLRLIVFKVIIEIIVFAPFVEASICAVESL